MTVVRISARLPWPLPALLTWAAAWSVFLFASRWLKLPTPIALLIAVSLGITLSLRADTRWRRLFVAWGFPLSVIASGLVAELPTWPWLFPLALLAIVYPVQAWHDAPWFPTPRHALTGLASLVPLRSDARVLDAGCGLGHGLLELRREYPQAQLSGMEWSWPLRVLCAWRTPFASVRRADIWDEDWSGYDLVYLFQRSDSMARAALKAGRELRPGAWMASLEFSVPGMTPTRTLRSPDGRNVWLYQAPFKRR